LEIKKYFLKHQPKSRKGIGILRCVNGDILSDTSAVCVDSEDNIWVGHHNQGTVSVLKPNYKKCIQFLNEANTFCSDVSRSG
jgi:hypothetical protein